MLQPDQEAVTAPRREHIICVDDEEGILTALRQQLVSFQDECDIDLTQSGQEALDLIRALERTEGQWP